ncbi:glycosyltransferase family 2 protein [Thalassotalea fusca]
MTICVVIPAMNEALTIKRVVTSVVDCGYSVVVVNDASSDDTAILAEEAGATVLSNVVNLGAWKSTQAGLRYAAKLGFKTVVTMDADGQHHAQDIKLLLKKQAKGADVVIGQCTSRGSMGRHIAWRFFRLINRLEVSDITSGFRLYNNKALNCLISRQASMFEYQCVGVLIMMRNVGLTIDEAPVTMNERLSGASRIFHSWTAVGYYLLYSGLMSTTKAFPTKKDRYIKRLQD